MHAYLVVPRRSVASKGDPSKMFIFHNLHEAKQKAKSQSQRLDPTWAATLFQIRLKQGFNEQPNIEQTADFCYFFQCKSVMSLRSRDRYFCELSRALFD